MRHRPAALAAALLVVVLGTGPVNSASAAEFGPWAPAAEAAIHPGIATDSEGAGCTANYVFTDRAGALYLGQAAHCTSDSGGLTQSGCETASSPLGTPVGLDLSGVTGTLAYSSWLTMQKRGETDEGACNGNDFALVRVPAAARPMVNPSVPTYGGPTGLASAAPAIGAPVYGYGNSNIRGGLSPLSTQRGVAVGSDESGWYHLVLVLPPGVPGDSGGGVMDAEGRAYGVLISLNTVPPGSNGLTDLAKALAYAQQHSGIKGLRLVVGTEPFNG